MLWFHVILIALVSSHAENNKASPCTHSGEGGKRKRRKIKIKSWTKGSEEKAESIRTMVRPDFNKVRGKVRGND